MASPEDFIIRFTDPARADGELDGSTFIIKPFTVNGPQHPIVDVLFTDPETGTAISKQAPIVLYGKGVPEYGEQIANNWLQVAENFAGSSQPLITTTAGDPLPGVTWFQDEKYWVDTVAEDIFVWDDIGVAWVNVTGLTTTNSVTFDIEADRDTLVPNPVTGDYYYATDTNQLFVFYVWSDFTPTIQAWLSRISRQETSAPGGSDRPRRTLSVYDPTDTVEGFLKLLSYKGNDVGDPINGELHITGNVFPAEPTVDTHATTKLYVDTEILAAVGGNNQLHQLLDVDPLINATLGGGPPPSNGQFLIFDTSLVDGNVDGKWTNHTLAAADVSDFSTAADARIAAASVGDLSDVDLAGIGVDDILKWDGAKFIQSTVVPGNLTAVVDDGSPQLGGNLDLNGFLIESLDISNATVQTNSATPTTLQTIAIPTDTRRIITARVFGHEAATDDVAWAYIRTGVKNVSGVTSVVGGTASDTGSDAGAVTWSVSIITSGANILILATGEAAKTIDWETTTEVS